MQMTSNPVNPENVWSSEDKRRLAATPAAEYVSIKVNFDVNRLKNGTVVCTNSLPQVLNREAQKIPCPISSGKAGAQSPERSAHKTDSHDMSQELRDLKHLRDQIERFFQLIPEQCKEEFNDNIWQTLKPDQQAQLKKQKDKRRNKKEPFDRELRRTWEMFCTRPTN